MGKVFILSRKIVKQNKYVDFSQKNKKTILCGQS